LLLTDLSLCGPVRPAERRLFAQHLKDKGAEYRQYLVVSSIDVASLMTRGVIAGQGAQLA
jgi:hypothetical protein